MTPAFLVFFLLSASASVAADVLTIAVASNFLRPAEAIAERFHAEHGQPVRIASGSTGKLYAQIVNGAPFDVFLAADADRPGKLAENGLGVASTRKAYAIGSLVLWSVDPRLVDGDCREALEVSGSRKLAIANPDTAPYGSAAREFLEFERLWRPLQPRLVFGESVAQVLHFVATGNAGFGLIAQAQLYDERLPSGSCAWPVPASTHSPIEQQAIVLTGAPDRSAAIRFVEFLESSIATDIITTHGYVVP